MGTAATVILMQLRFVDDVEADRLFFVIGWSVLFGLGLATLPPVRHLLRRRYDVDVPEKSEHPTP